MIEAAVNAVDLDSVEAILREELARGDAVSQTAVPILRHLLASSSNSMFSDEIVARVRGLVTDLARQLLDTLAIAAGESERREHDPAETAALTDAFLENPALVRHLHATALEWQMTHRLQSRIALDPVLSPLLQSLIASQDGATSALAMKLLASQARFCQSQRRMQIPLNELPGDLLHGALVSMRALAGVEPLADERAAAAEAQIRMQYSEAATRIGLIARLVQSLGGHAVAALSIPQAGVALFLTALSFGAGQDRDLSVLSSDESQLARFALQLRAAGLKPNEIEEQFLVLHPEIALPEGFERLSADRAAAILSIANYSGG